MDSPIRVSGVGGVPNLEKHFDFRLPFLGLSHDWREEYFLVDFWGDCVVVLTRQFGRGARQHADWDLQGCRVNSFASLSAIFRNGVLPSSCWAVEAMEMHIAQPMRRAFLKNWGSLQRLQDSTASSWVVCSASISAMFLIFFRCVFEWAVKRGRRLGIF